MYVKINDLMVKYDISRSMVNKILMEMQLSKRYPRSVDIGYRSCRRISAEAFQDYFENMELLRCPNTCKYVDPYKGG